MPTECELTPFTEWHAVGSRLSAYLGIGVVCRRFHSASLRLLTSMQQTVLQHSAALREKDWGYHMSKRIASLMVLATLLFALTASAKDSEEVKFEGLIERLPAVGMVGDWIVSGHIVRVSSATDIKQKQGIVVGLDVFVRVKGSLLVDGSVRATEIEVEAGPGVVHQARFSGFVDKLPGSGLIGEWVVNGRTLHVSNATDVKMQHGLAALNASVDIKGFMEDDGSITVDDLVVEASPGSDHEFEFEGFVQKAPSGGSVGDWTVEERVVHVTGSTEIKGLKTAVLNGFVKVKGLLLAAGSIDAGEIELKASSGSTRQFDFGGFVDKLPDGGLVGDWVVNGHLVHLGTDARVKQEHGLATQNALVKVKGLLLADGSVLALEIQVDASPVRAGRVKFQGFIDRLPSSGFIGDWMVSGRVVHVSVDTRVKLKNLSLAVGSLVEIKGFLEADGAVTARKITLKL